MIYSRRYARLFITMQQEAKDYSLNSKPCMGRGIIEIKNNSGKITLYLQGLKPDKFYKAMLVSSETAVPIGNISIDSSGKGELKYHFNPDEIGTEKNKIEYFSTLAVTVDENNTIKVPMAGHTEKAVNWKKGLDIYKNKSSSELMNKAVNNSVHSFSDNSSKINQNPIENEKIVDNSANKEKNYQQNNTPNPSSVDNSVDKVDNSASAHISDNIDYKDVIDRFKKNMLELEHYTFLKKEEIEGVNTSAEKMPSDIEIIKKRAPVDIPLIIDNKQITFYKLYPEELGIINDALYPLSFSLFLASCCKTESPLLGIYNENGWEKQIIAVPCKNSGFADEAARFGLNEYNNGFFICRL